MDCLEEKGSFWVLNPNTSDWSVMSPADPALPYPEARSYHALGSDSEQTLSLRVPLRHPPPRKTFFRVEILVWMP